MDSGERGMNPVKNLKFDCNGWKKLLVKEEMLATNISFSHNVFKPFICLDIKTQCFMYRLNSFPNNLILD